MKHLGSLDEVLDFAIRSEEESAKLYQGLAKTAKTARMRDVFDRFAKEELGHKAKILKIRKTGSLEHSAKEIVDLKIGESLADVEAGENLDYQDALILAMKREKNAFRLYKSLAEATDDEGTRTLFQSLAEEEAKHKLYFEIEYDDNVLTGN